MITYSHYRLLLMILLVVGWSKGANAQEALVELDTGLLRGQINQLKVFYDQGNWTEVMNLGQNALESCQRVNFLAGEADCFWLLAQANRELGLMGAVQFNLLGAERVYADLANERQLGYVHWALAEYYVSISVPKMALKYYETARGELPADQKSEWELPIHEKEAQLYRQVEDYGNALKTYEVMLANYEQSGEDKVASELYLTIAQLAYEMNDLQTMERYTKALLSKYEEKEDQSGLSTAYNNLGFLYKRQGDLRTSTEYFEQSVRLVSAIDARSLPPAERAQVWANAGVAFTNLGVSARALDYYSKALKVWVDEGAQKEQAEIQNYIAASYYVMGKNLDAQTSVNKAIALAEPLEAKNVLQTSYRILALVYEQVSNEAKAEEYQKQYRALVRDSRQDEDLRRRQSLQDQREAEQGEQELRQQILAQRGLIQEAERQENQLRLQQQELALLQNQEELRRAELVNRQLEADRAQKQLAFAEQALEAERQQRQLAVLEQQQREQQTALRQRELEDEASRKEIEILETQNALQEAEISRQATFQRFTLIGGVLGGLILLLMAYSFWQKQRDNKKLKIQQAEIKETNEELQTNQEALEKSNLELEQKNANITSSITYAQRIQEAMLPSQFVIREHLPESFILFLPRDIVSGDFFWFADKGDRIFIAAVDCTGHGVPGAFMSMIGTQLLNDLVNKYGLTESDEILNELHAGVLKALKQEQTQNNDGMDMALCVIHKETHTVQFSGAKNPLMVVRNGDIEVIKGDRYPIGGSQIARRGPYHKHTVEVKADTTFYIYSDGFQDQYGGPDNRKFMTKHFRTLLHKLHGLSMRQQQKELETVLADWQGDLPQVDDILVMGFRLKPKVAGEKEKEETDKDERAA